MNQNTENMSLEEALVYIKALKDENERLKQQNANLTEQIIRNQKKMYGKSSEQIRYIYDSEQLSFFNEAEQEYSASAPEPTKETLVAAHTRKAKRTKAEITENLEHKEIICDLEDKHCPECGEELVCIGKEFVRRDKYIIQPNDSHTTSLAGLYRFEERNGLQVPVFSVLTRDAIGELRGIHDRMPLILKKEDVLNWIRPNGNPQEIVRRTVIDVVFEKLV